ncbi:MAG: hypothetical protein K2I22_16355 [Lachnospiraceae bacterium]|nr:hypothetical protein [Lachnospiraceae bacterium]
MKTKKVFFSEVAYILGIIVLALGTAMMKRADFGLSMVVAPAYLLHLKISQYVPAFSFGMAEYSLQAVLLVIMSISLRKFKPIYLFSFVTAVIYGFTLDIAIRFVDILPLIGMVGRIIYYLIGMVFCAFGVSLLFHTYISPEVYELFVKEISAKSGKDINIIKTVYDCVSCLVGITLSFAFFGLWHFEGVKPGTIICAFVNGFLIGCFSKMTESVFDFKDALNLREKFEFSSFK